MNKYEKVTTVAVVKQPRQVDAPTPITQDQLQELVRRVSDHNALGLSWNRIRSRVAMGDPVEAGEIEPILVPDEVGMNQLQYQRAVDVFGQEKADAMRADLTTKAYMRLKLKIGDQIFGFYDL